MTKPVPAYATRSQIKRVVDAARDAGIDVGGVEVTPEGTIRVMTVPVPAPPRDAYEEWKNSPQEVARRVKERLAKQGAGTR